MMLSNIARALGIGLVLAVAPALADQPGPKRSCLSPGETREMAAARKLSSPFIALRTAGAHARGETIGVRLCRVNEELVYDVTVLRRDGRVVRVILDAMTGKIVRTLNDR